MKLSIILAIAIVIIVIIAGFFIVQYMPVQPASNETQTDGSQTQPAVPEIQNLALSEQDLQQLGMTQAWDDTECQTQEYYTFSENQIQYRICNYTIDSLDDTWVIIELKRFTELEDMNNAYQYDTSHLFGAEGLISENDYGDQSRFRVNSEDDYGAEYNEPGVYFYHLWFTKGLYFVHITSMGTQESARDNIAETGRLILSKFG